MMTQHNSGPQNAGSPIITPPVGLAAGSSIADAEVLHRRPDIKVALQSLIIPGAKVDEGVMIQAVNIPWIMIVNELNEKPMFLLD